MLFRSRQLFRILTNEQYTGTYIAGKRETSRIGTKKMIEKDKSEWFIYPNQYNGSDGTLTAFYSIKKQRLFFKPLYGFASFVNEDNTLWGSVEVGLWAKNDYLPQGDYDGKNIEYEITNELVDYYLAKIPDNRKSFALSFKPECIVLYVNELQVDRFGVPE